MYWLMPSSYLMNALPSMVLILDGNSEHVAHASRKIGLFEEKNTICDFSRSNQMP